MIMEMTNCHELIPGLPSELAIECLIRVPYQFHPDMKSVCHSWKKLLSNSSFFHERLRTGKTELLLCLVQPLPPSKAAEEEGEKKWEIKTPVCVTPRFGLSVYNATLSTWNRVMFPEEKIPIFCECVVLQDAGKVLLIGGWDPETLQPVKDVHVLDFTVEGRKWRRGASMSESRSFFACTSVGTKVYVAGGHDEQKNALHSAEVYDVEKDEWLMIAPMMEGRDECQGMAVETGFCVFSGYRTESQGRFRSDGEIYDPETNSWSKIENVWPFPDNSPRGRLVGDIRESSRLYCFADRELQGEIQSEIEDDTRKWILNFETMQLPVKGSSIFAGSLGGETVVLTGGNNESEGKGVMMKTAVNNTGKWSHVDDIPSGFSTLPFSHASIYV